MNIRYKMIQEEFQKITIPKETYTISKEFLDINKMQLSLMGISGISELFSQAVISYIEILKAQNPKIKH